jgi:hypothetical protein
VESIKCTLFLLEYFYMPTPIDYDAAIRAIVDAAPPLTDAQRDKLATLLADAELAEVA